MNERFNLMIEKAGDPSGITFVQSIAGHVYIIETKNRRYLLKTLPQVPRDFFLKEAESLREIKKANGIRVPHVYCASEPDSNIDGFIVMDYIEGKKSALTEQQLGTGLAKMHQHHAQSFGFHSDNYIGNLNQPNGWHEDWATFYRDHRLSIQAEYAEKRGRMTGNRKKMIVNLLDRLDELLPISVQPSLLHGDLWGGNWIVGPGGEPYVIDPAVSYGDRHMDLAFSEYFGGYSASVYAAYNEQYPIGAEYEEIKLLYQLYYVLVHLTLFGESYGAEVDRILQYYT